MSALEPWGEPRPIPRDRWDEHAARSTRAAHPDLVDLLLTLGPGRICGLFDVPDPTLDDAWESLRRRFLRLRDHGLWPGLLDGDVEDLVVFATDARGAAMGCTPNRFWFLGPRGELLDAGRALRDLVTTFVCGSIHRTYALPADVDLGCQPLHLVAGSTGLDEYIEALQAGRDAESLLEGAMVSQPLLLSHREILAALCGPRGDAIAVEARNEAVDLVTRIATRRAPTFAAVLLPPSFDRGTATTDPAVRAWAQNLLPLGPIGPFAKPDPDPATSPIRVAAPLHHAAYVPSEDPMSWVQSHAEALRRSDPDLGSGLTERALALPVSEIAGYVRQIVQLDAHRRYLCDAPAGGIEWEPRPGERAAAASARLAVHVDRAWPLLALAVAASRNDLIQAQAAAVLHGARDPLLARLWLRAIVVATPPVLFGADPWTLAVRYAASCHVSDELVATCLPALRKGCGVIALLLSSRVDRGDVVAALLEQYPAFACVCPWDGRTETRHVFSQAAPLAADVLREAAGARVSDERAPIGVVAQADVITPAAQVRPMTMVSERPGPPAPRLAAPRVKGAPQPITAALVQVGGKRVLDRLRAVARDKKIDLTVRTEAARGLLAVDAPAAAEVEEDLEQAWDRYWRF
jgi:hypothetical protein